jgi:formylglycine-generating enzyme required for sulfatase activity
MGRNGLYTAYLKQYLVRPGLKVEEMFKKVRRAVIDKNPDQVPWENSSITGDFCFAGCGPDPDVEPVAQAEEAKPVRREPEPPPEPPPPPRTCADCPEMVDIPGGEFWMGSDASDPDAQGDEKPRHKLRVGSFKLGRHEVTKAQFAAFVADSGYQAGASCYTYDNGSWGEHSGRGWNNPGFSQGDDHPVACVSYEDAQAYIRWLNKKTGRSYRLPTEAEWEYAARAGTTTIRHWGDSPDSACRYANVADRTAKQTFTGWTVHNCSDGYVYTAPAGSFQANGFGLYDMQGNVWEWTCSAYTDRYDGSEKSCTNDAMARRGVRGGAWDSRPVFVRSAYRDGNVPSYRGSDLGFRLAQD